MGLGIYFPLGKKKEAEGLKAQNRVIEREEGCPQL